VDDARFLAGEWEGRDRRHGRWQVGWVMRRDGRWLLGCRDNGWQVRWLMRWDSG